MIAFPRIRDCQYWKRAPPLAVVEIEDLICCSNPLGFCLRQFVKPQHLLQHFGNTGTQQVHSIISPWVVDFLIFFFCSIFRETVLFPASVFLSTPWQQVRATSKSVSSLFCFFEVLFAFTGPLKPAFICGELSILPTTAYIGNIQYYMNRMAVLNCGCFEKVNNVIILCGENVSNTPNIFAWHCCLQCSQQYNNKFSQYYFWNIVILFCCVKSGFATLTDEHTPSVFPLYFVAFLLDGPFLGVLVNNAASVLLISAFHSYNTSHNIFFILVCKNLVLLIIQITFWRLCQRFRCVMRVAANAAQSC